MFTAPTTEEAIINATFFRVHLNVDPLDGTSLDSTHAHCTISELDLIEQYYPTRNALGLVDFRNHKVRGADSTGIEKMYVVIKWHPDEVLGIIRLILQEHAAN
jgi:hypothetical protein